jgi:hypothetical protein
MRDRAGESLRGHAYPDRRVGCISYPILGGLDEWDVVVEEVGVLYVVVVFVIFVVFLLDLLVILLVKPREPNQIDGGELDASFVKEFDNLGTNLSSRRLAETSTHLITNTIPTTILAELMILGNWTKLHQTSKGTRPFSLDEFVIGGPIYKLGTTTTGTKTSII